MSAINVAQYFLNKDPERKFFNNARLNKYLHLAQNIYIAMTGEALIDVVFYAYDNGAVSIEVQENYNILLGRNNVPIISDEHKIFLDKIYYIFQNATLDELIDLSHEDSAWIEKNNYYKKEDQKMDQSNKVAEYKEQYSDIVKVMSKIT